MVELSRHPAFGLSLVVGDGPGIIRSIIDAAGRPTPGWAAFANAHMVVECRRSPILRRALAGARWVVPDGRPLAWTLRRCGRRMARQIAGPATMAGCCSAAASQGVPVALYGGEGAVTDRLVTELRHRYPKLRIVAVINPPYRDLSAAEEEADRRRLIAAGARMIFVSLGCPKQELWCSRNSPQLPGVCLAVGAAFPMLAGMLPRAPAVWRRRGLEWLYRLGQEPRRLWRRYLTTNPAFLNLALRELWRR
jgi:N-acetylglucosaminyldiphosphoundecaprenol N-acetyl-beta-D-mannosaminyltransferase